MSQLDVSTEAIAPIFAALGDPTRARIVGRLSVAEDLHFWFGRRCELYCRFMSRFEPIPRSISNVLGICSHNVQLTSVRMRADLEPLGYHPRPPR